MKHYQQRSQECLLAAVCAVEGLDYNDQAQWKQYRCSWDGIFALVVKHADYLLPTLRVLVQAGPVIGRDSSGVAEPELSGTGFLFLFLSGRHAEDGSFIPGTRGRHAVAFDNGLIFDSALSGPFPFQEWAYEKEQRDGPFVIERIVRKPEGPTGQEPGGRPTEGQP